MSDDNDGSLAVAMISYFLASLSRPLRRHWVLTTLVLLPFILKLYSKLTADKCKSNRQLHGRTVIITGSNTGLGLETARELARRRAKVILACRDLKKAKKAREDIIITTKNQNVKVKHLDVSSLESVRKFCKEILSEEFRLDVLVNNAGVFAMNEKIITEDNLEKQMATNYFGPFLLTNLLLGILVNTPDSRIVNLSSVAHKIPKLDLDNLNSEKYFKPTRIYNVSKLLIILFTKELARRLRGTTVTCNSVHPGVVATDLLKTIPFIFQLLMTPFAKSVKEGAEPIIHAAVSEQLEKVTGKYLSGCKICEPSETARDPHIAKKLWDISEKMVGLTEEETYLK